MEGINDLVGGIFEVVGKVFSLGISSVAVYPNGKACGGHHQDEQDRRSKAVNHKRLLFRQRLGKLACAHITIRLAAAWMVSYCLA